MKWRKTVDRMINEHRLSFKRTVTMATGTGVIRSMHMVFTQKELLELNTFKFSRKYLFCYHDIYQVYIS